MIFHLSTHAETLFLILAMLSSVARDTIKAFFKQTGFVNHHLESFAHFIQNIIPETISETVGFVHESENYKFSYHFSNPYFHKPGVVEHDGVVTEMYPNQARLRNLTYSSPLFCQVNKKFTSKLTGEIKENTETIFCGLVPTMVRSIQCRLHKASDDEVVAAKECKLDQGGYFIVNGTEKVLMGMERMCVNHVNVFPNKHDPDDIYAEISSIEERAKKAPCSFYLHLIPSSSMGKKSIRAFSNYFKKEFAVGILFKALGMNEGIRDAIFKHRLFVRVKGLKRKELNLLLDSIEEESFHIRDQEQAFVYLTKIASTQGSTNDKSETYIHAVLQKEFLPHVGIDDTATDKKIAFLVYMVQKLLQVHFGQRDYDDHDHAKNKRTDESGVLIGNIFKQVWSKINRELQLMVKKKMEGGANLKDITITQLLNNMTFTKDLNYVLSTGNWSVTRNSKMRTGVSQVLNRFNYQATLSHCRRNVNPMPKNSVLSKPRQLHNSTWGTKCVTGDTEVTLANGSTIPIKDLNGKIHEVLTVNPKTLEQSSSKIHHYFSAIPDKLYEVKTISGRSVKCTGDHPFLVKTLLGHKWVNTCNLKGGDVVLVKHTPRRLSKEGERLTINPILIAKEGEREKLRELGLVGKELTVEKMEILARILGMLWADGSCGEFKARYMGYADFYFGQREDAEDMMQDIQRLGFSETEIFCNEKEFRDSAHHIYKISRKNSFASLMTVLGVHYGKKSITESPDLPEWIKVAAPSVKREFLAGFQGGDGGRMYISHENKGKETVKMNATRQYCHPDQLNAKMKLMTSIAQLFNEFGINAHANHSEAKINHCANNLVIVEVSISMTRNNLIKYGDVVWYRYSREKIYASAHALEYLKTKQVMMQQKKSYAKVFEEAKKGGNIEYSEQEISIKDFDNFQTKTDVVYSTIMDNPKEVPVETVYDFTVFSDNHSFVAGGITTHNCPFETPEGPSIGLVTNKALSAHISVAFSDVFIANLLSNCLSPTYTDATPYMVFLNGKIAGWHDTDHPYRFIRELKLQGRLPSDIGVYPPNSGLEIHIWTDSGRTCRPLFIVQDNKIGMDKTYLDMVINGVKTWNDLIVDGIVEMVDSGEQETLMVCVKPEHLGKDGIEYTHCELSDSLIIGVCASIIPYASSDPSARITYQASMSKQALSVPGLNFQERMDTMSHTLDYPQKALCQTDAMEEMHSNDLPGGINAVVMITTGKGEFQEDALGLNRASRDRGMFRSTYTRVYREAESKTVGAEERFGRPNEPSAHKLALDGIVPVGIIVEDGDMVIGKISTSIGLNGQPIKPRCVFIGHGGGGVVDKVVLSTNPNNTRSVKVRIRQVRNPEIGDKFAAVHSQKGVIGAIINPEDLPFTMEGINPDIIINPHSQPSRMTEGHMKELRSGKYGAISGTFPDSTIFGTGVEEMEKMGDELVALGYERRGWEQCMCGITGKPMKALIYTGVCFYQRLKHMVQDKIHCRSGRGPIATLSHQPADGRSRDGGLRVGEMERDTLISLGGSHLIQSMLMNLSDRYKTVSCDSCGLLAIANPEKKIYVCKACKSKKVSWIHLPYATKLLISELYAVGIAPRLLLG